MKELQFANDFIDSLIKEITPSLIACHKLGVERIETSVTNVHGIKTKILIQFDEEWEEQA